MQAQIQNNLQGKQKRKRSPEMYLLPLFFNASEPERIVVDTELDKRYISRLLLLAFLVSDIIESIP